ncbi:putative sporulation protein YyaC [Planococcus glaciei]|uniref:spore protease YyaC n=1 Tax=Planococcus glaciei TaxID=459472 RepID=UPI000888875A|nr:spore protease YyaC [Planococcus glaciei]SDG75641.1 putative sporulation protein YyaC [Planococcus glaciei]
MHTFRKYKNSHLQVPVKAPLHFNEATGNEEMGLLIAKLKSIFAEAKQQEREVVFLCIGSDRYIGDSLGPLIGSMMQENGISHTVYGTLEEPVHAFNLKATLKDIYRQNRNPLVISIDASLGTKEQVGNVLFNEGPLVPGKALEKMLPEVGDYHFQGIVNYLDPLPSSQFLNDTRLHTVMKLAKLITEIIVDSDSE